MDVYGIQIPDKSLSNFDLIKYADDLNISNFRGVFMRDELPKIPRQYECGIVNFNTSSESGTHWVAYYKNGKNRIYFDSYGQVVLQEINDYLKTKSEKKNDKAVIARNTDIVQKPNTQICGHLCLYVLKSLSIGQSYRDILDFLTTKKGAGITWTNSMANEPHRPVRHKFLKRFVFVRNVDDVWGADLVDMQKMAKMNSGYRYILMIIDVFSKYGWAVPLKNKSSPEVSNALHQIFKKKQM